MPWKAIYDAGRRGRRILWLAALGATAAAAQPAPTWTLALDGVAEPWPAEASLPADSMAASRMALSLLHARGLFNAVVDSVDVARATAFARSGPVLPVASVRVADLPGALEGAAGEVSRMLVGRPLDSRRLQAAALLLLEAMERQGRPGASVRVVRLAPDSTGGRLELDLAVDPGSPVVLQGIIVHGAARTSPRLVELLSGLSPGTGLRAFDAADIARSLDETGLFASVMPPVLLATGDSTAIVQFVIEDAAPGVFDAALGYQPGRGGGSGALVGTGRLTLVNPFGGGRRFDVLIDRLPGQVSRAELSASDPFFLSWPVEVGGAFSGLQQDSTFGKQTWRLGAAIRLARTLSLTVSGTREVSRPGAAGTEIVGGRQAIPRSDGLFGGIGIRYRSLDRGLSPSRGLVLEMRVERGAYSRRATEVSEQGDTTRVSVRTRAERLTASGRAFLPVGRSWVAVTGVDAALLVSDVVDRTDLFRIGGARSLRGYDEDRFEGSAAGRGVAEIRRLLDLRSYAFVFADFGFVDTPAGLGPAPGLRFRPGYGFGLQLDTAAGLVTATYGFNPEDGPTNGRIHVAFSFGL